MIIFRVERLIVGDVPGNAVRENQIRIALPILAVSLRCDVAAILKDTGHSFIDDGVQSVREVVTLHFFIQRFRESGTVKDGVPAFMREDTV